METTIEKRRIILFLVFAYGIAWATGLVIYLTGGLVNSPQLTSGLPLALLLMAIPYMWAPAFANVLVRLITHEGWHDNGLRPHFRRGWPYWLMGWVLPAVMTIAGAALFFLLYPHFYDPALTRVQTALNVSSTTTNLSLWAVLAIQVGQAVLLAPILNALATFGEEFGWRAYLLPKLLPLGWRKACLLIGLIWGVWHWPVIFMGYEYGFSYPGFPWLGPLLFIWITFCFGVFLGWLTIRSGSVWPAVIGHAAINGIAGLAAYATTGIPDPLLGPLPVGIIGSAGFAIVALILFWNPGFQASEPLPAGSQSQSEQVQVSS